MTQYETWCKGVNLLQRLVGIQQIAYMMGFTEQSSLNRFFKNYEGMSPNEYRNKK